MLHDEVVALLARCAELLDAGDFDGVGELFADGALSAPDGTPFARGATEVAKFFTRNTLLHDGSPRTKHVVTTTSVEESPRIVARSSYVVFQSAPDFPLQAIVAGRYADELVRDEGGRLRFADRRFFVDLEGDLSHHLRRPELARPSTGKGPGSREPFPMAPEPDRNSLDASTAP